MAAESKSGWYKPFVPFVIGMALVVVAWVITARAGSGIESLSGRERQQPAPPPPSETLLEAPGPDNTIQDFHPKANLPRQPPSPIASETDPSKRPKKP